VGDAVSWVYALAANRGAWSSGLRTVDCVVDEKAARDRLTVRGNVYRLTPTSAKLIWTPVTCGTLVVRSYQLQYAPTKRPSGSSVW